jgi:hypothetical protein
MLRSELLGISLTAVLCTTSGPAINEAQSTPPHTRDSKRIQNFVALDGKNQVRTFFRDGIDKPLLLRLPGRDGWIEQEFLIASPDVSIEVSLAAETKHSNPKHAGFAAFLLCRRAQFFPQSTFPIPQFRGTRYSEHVPLGLLSPFVPDLDRLIPEAREAVRQSMQSSSTEVRNTARLYCGELSREFSTIPAPELAHRWRSKLFQLRAPIYYKSDVTEAGEEVRLLRRALIEKGINGALGLEELLQDERQPLARDLEIDLIAELDSESERLRGSEKGREVVQTIENIVAQEKLELYSTKQLKQEYLKSLRGRFYNDEYLLSEHWDWSDMLLYGFNKYFDESISVPDRARVRDFVAYLTSIDPTYPSWEFVSSGSQEDMLHPRFRSKIKRYHEAWIKFNESQPSSSRTEGKNRALPIGYPRTRQTAHVGLN